MSYPERTLDADDPDSAAMHAMLGGLRPPGLDGQTQASLPAASQRTPMLDRGDVVGRYVITARLGQGGMGVVFAAYDPELDRKVAIKLLLGEAPQATMGRTRLLREAQALAQLAHPNVVAIHDVGTLGAQVWLAMEFVAGQTLGAWLKQARRGWREVLAVFRRAGEGLAAAHAAGLVHRDFKPDNVMVAADGRVRVMDFGLARAEQGERLEVSEPGLRETLDDGRPITGALSQEVTRAGVLMGTPGYMSPEQWQAEPTDPRTDQFSFCVALWEALYGQRPFTGDGLPELVHAVTEGLRRPPPPGSDVPTWLRRALERGLAVAPAQRWPSMPALLEALATGARRRRRNLALAGALAVTGLLGAGAGLYAWDHARSVADCEAQGASIHGVWSEAARERLAAQLGPATFERVAPFVDRFAASWAGAQTHVCVQHKVERGWDDELATRARECLLEASWSLEGVIAVLGEADPETAIQAVAAAAALPQLAPCLDPGWLAERPPVPRDPPARAEIAELRRALEQLHARRFAPDYAGGLARAQALRLRADALGWAPLVAHATLIAGDFTGRGGDLQGEARLLEDAFFVAVAAGDEVLAIDAAIGLTHTVGYSLAQHDLGLRWARYARARLVRLRGGGDLREAALRNSLAALHFGRGDHEQALRLSEEALAIRERVLGHDHPSLGTSLNNLAAMRWTRGEYREARALHARALELRRRVLGPDHPEVAMSLHNLALAHESLGDPTTAARLAGEAVAIRERSLGPTHPELASSLLVLANITRARGAAAASVPLYERAWEIWRASLGPEHPSTAHAIHNLAVARLVLGEGEVAWRLEQQALTIWTAALGPRHPDLAYALTGLGETALALGRPADAVPLLERAIALRGADAPPHTLAEPRFALAQALWAGGDRSRARELAREAAASYASDPATLGLRAEVEAWLAGPGALP